jgi:hypothetical protein
METLTHEECKVQLNGKFTLHHQVLKDGMEFLKFNQGVKAHYG